MEIPNRSVVWDTPLADWGREDEGDWILELEEHKKELKGAGEGTVEDRRGACARQWETEG